jgi:hypothetical protein
MKFINNIKNIRDVALNIKILRLIKMMSLSALRVEMKLVPTSESVLTFQNFLLFTNSSVKREE